MTDKNLQLISTVSDDNKLTLSLQDIDMPTPGADEIVVRIEAAPLNPSDFGVMFSAADMSTAVQSGTEQSPVVTADVPAKYMPSLKTRVGKNTPVGNEGAGTVIAAGSSPEAQALMGKMVAVIGGGTYRQYHCVNVKSCLVLKEGTTAKEGASSFVNPSLIASFSALSSSTYFFSSSTCFVSSMHLSPLQSICFFFTYIPIVLKP